MNIFNKITLQALLKSRTRTIVTIIGVVLSTALITAVATFGVSLLSYMTAGAIDKYGDWHVGFWNVDSSFVQERINDEEVTNTAAFENVGYGALDGGENPEKPYFFIAGFSDESFDTLPVTLLSGRLPENSSEILISGKVLTDGGLSFKVGETLSLAVGSRMNGTEKLGWSDPYISAETLVPETEKTYTVVGICKSLEFEETNAPGYTLITKADPADQADDFNVFVTLKNPRGVRAYAQGVSEIGAYALNDYVLRFMGISDNNIFLVFLYSIGLIVLAIIMIGSIFLIYNAFTISLNERTRQFGILSSVGATAKQLRNSVLFEGLCIGAVGIPIGVLVGIGGIGLVIAAVAGNFESFGYSTVSLTLTVSVPAIAAAAAVSLVTILISAYIPARKAATTPVMESIRQTGVVKVEGKAVKTSKLARRIYGLEGTLALKSFKRNKKRYRSVILSLGLSIVLFVSGSAFGTEMKQASEMLTEFTTYDIALATPDMDDSNMLKLYDKLKTVDGVSESMYQASMRCSCTVKASDLSDYYWENADLPSSDDTVDLSMSIQFIGDSEYLSILEELGLPTEEYTGQDAKLTAVAKMPLYAEGGRSEELETMHDLFANSSINAEITPNSNGSVMENVNVTLVEIVPPDELPITTTHESQPYTIQMMAPYSLKEQFETQDTTVDIKGMTFTSTKPSQSVEAMENIIQGEGGIATGYFLYNMSKLVEESRSQIFIVNVFTYVFTLMITLIAAANVFNTISTNIKLRRRELAMLRSVGMADRDFNKMMNFECAFYGIRALAYGLPLAGISSWLIYKGLAIAGADSIDYVFPWVSMAISVLGVFFIVFTTMLYTTSKIKKENIIDALRDDMT